MRFFTFGMTQYVFQTFLLLIMIVLLRRFRLSYLFSFLSAFVFGLIALILSFSFFGMWHFVGVSWGTVVTSLVNGWIIARCSKLFEKCFRFEDLFPLRKFFENI